MTAQVSVSKMQHIKHTHDYVRVNRSSFHISKQEHHQSRLKSQRLALLCMLYEGTHMLSAKQAKQVFRSESVILRMMGSYGEQRTQQSLSVIMLHQCKVDTTPLMTASLNTGAPMTTPTRTIHQSIE